MMKEEFFFELEYIIITREIRLRTRVIKEYLIKWKNLPEEDATWDSEQLRQPHLSLNSFEDKAPLKGVAM